MTDSTSSIYDYIKNGLFWLTWNNIQGIYVPGASLLSEEGATEEDLSHKNITLQNKDILKFKMIYALENFENTALDAEEVANIKVLRSIIFNLQKGIELVTVLNKIGYFSDIAGSLNWIHNNAKSQEVTENTEENQDETIFYSSGENNLHIAVKISENSVENSELLVQYLTQMLENSQELLDRQLMDIRYHWITFLSKSSRQKIYKFLTQDGRTEEFFPEIESEVPYKIKFPLD